MQPVGGICAPDVFRAVRGSVLNVEECADRDRAADRGRSKVVGVQVRRIECEESSELGTRGVTGHIDVFSVATVAADVLDNPSRCSCRILNMGRMHDGWRETVAG